MTLHEDVELCVPKVGPLRSYLEWAVQTTDAEHHFHLGSILPCLADECVTSGFVVEPQRRMRPTIWTFLVGAPAAAKSTALKRAAALYKTFLAQRAGRQVADPFIFAEGSWPGIFEALAERYDQQIGLAHGIVTRDEASRLLETRETSIADNLCNVIDGEEVKRHLRSVRAENRANPGSVKDFLRAPAFSGVLATTFARIRDVTQASFIEGGLYSRFLWFVGGAQLPEPRLEIDMHEALRKRVIDEWLDWGRWLLGMQTLHETHERVVTFSPEADDCLRSTLWEEHVRHVRELPEDRLNATRKRGLTQVRVLAAIYALSQQRTIVDYDDMLCAVNLIELSTSGLGSLDQKFLPSASSQNPKALSDLAFTTIRAHGATGGCPRALLYKTMQCPKSMLDLVIDTLIDEGSIAIVEAPKRQGSGRQPQLYRATRQDRYGAEPKRTRPKLHLITTPTEPPPASEPVDPGLEPAPEPLDPQGDAG